MEAVTGGRFHPNYDRIGGIKEDLPKGWVAEAKDGDGPDPDLLRPDGGPPRRQRHLRDPHRAASASSPPTWRWATACRAPTCGPRGIDWDLRRDGRTPLAWKEADWKVWTHPDGDSFARYWVRLQEVREATGIIDQLLDGLPSGPIMAKVPRIIKVPAGEAWCSTENPLGEMGYYIVSKGDLGPFRCKIRSASFSNVIVDALGAPGRVRARRHHHPRQPLLHPRGHRPVSSRESRRTGRRPGCGSAGVLGRRPGAGGGRSSTSTCFKMMSHMQCRLGPMEAGPHGSLQLFAEVAKSLQKEDIVPERADAPLFTLAPTWWSGRCFWSTWPSRSGPTPGSPNLDAGVFYALAVSSISVIGVLDRRVGLGQQVLAHRAACGPPASSSPTSCPMVLAVVGVVIQAGSLNLRSIVAAQADGEIFGFGGFGNPYVLTQFVGLGLFLIAAQAELTQAPFDMPVAESELVTGYITEYSGLRFLLFFIGEFAAAGVFAALAATLFLGGWWLPGLDAQADYMNFVGPLVLFGEDHAHRLPHLLGPLHLPPVPRGPAPDPGLEVPHPALAGEHPRDRRPQGGVLMPQLPGLLKGLGVTFKTITKPAVTVQYPHEKEEPTPRSRGVIALKEENCTVCMLCARELPGLVHLHRGPQDQGPAPPGRRQAPHHPAARPLRHRLRAVHVLRDLRRGVPVRRPLLEPRVRVLRAPHRRPPPRQGQARRVDGDGAGAPAPRSRRGEGQLMAEPCSPTSLAGTVRVDRACRLRRS